MAAGRDVYGDERQEAVPRQEIAMNSALRRTADGRRWLRGASHDAWNVSEDLAQDKAGLNFTKGHSQKQEMYARENAQM
ncbi:hypothetical protein BZM27_51420 [Paraburkholderia steynii]|uniref:Uncharacterized protein n=1 Tax=Paraburkholderia steynii TaxID=1245441 RepID=A0A4R0X877_9BURK|nr:hypothetical protein BZM27_51420 [Paraburkholderia steynii]